MIDPNPEPDSLTPAEADDGSDMSAYESVQWITPDDHQIDCLIDHDCWPEKAGDDLKLRFGQMLDAALAAHDMRGCTVSLLLCSDAKIRQLNHDHRGMDKATNVLSFPCADDAAMPDDISAMDRADGEVRGEQLGDIAIAYETCVREADESGISMHDHVTHLFGHGVLHLLGYDHEDEAEADEMEMLEVSLLAAMGIANPYDDVADDGAQDDAREDMKITTPMTEPMS
ncbi:MAG: rRNA maturation RNase YbeY [Candidatus Puniceispirillum sp.]